MRNKKVDNSARCEGCVNCITRKDKKVEMVYCLDRGKEWLFGQYIEPCHYYNKGENNNENN